MRDNREEEEMRRSEGCRDGKRGGKDILMDEGIDEWKATWSESERRKERGPGGR